MKPKKASAGASHDEEWVSSRMGEAELNRLVEVGVLPDRVTTGWQPASGEPFPMPNTDEVVVFEDYFWRGLGFPVHPFLRDLMELWVVSLCNLHPNTILHTLSSSIFVKHTLESSPTSTSFATCFGERREAAVVPRWLAECTFSCVTGWRGSTLLCRSTHH